MSDLASSEAVPADVALVLPTLEGGGAERVFKDLANSFVANGLKVDLVLAWARGPFLKQLDPRIRVIDLGCKGHLSVIPNLVQYFRRHRPRAILSGLEVMNISVIVAQMLSGIQVQIVISVHVVLSNSIRRSLRDSIVLVPMVRLLYPRAAGVVAVSQGVKDDLERWARLPDDRVRVVHNPVDLSAIDRAALEALPGGCTLGPKSVISVGRLSREKDHATLIRAFARVAAADPEVRLVILGDGPMRYELEALVTELGLEERISLPGFMDNPFAWMSRARLFVLSSRFEGFGNVIIEALAAGCPVVSTDCPGGPRMILDGGRFGRLTPVGEVEALAEAISEGLNNTHDRVALRNRAADFDLPVISDEYRRALNIFAAVPLSSIQRRDVTA